MHQKMQVLGQGKLQKLYIVSGGWRSENFTIHGPNCYRFLLPKFVRQVDGILRFWIGFYEFLPNLRALPKEVV